MSFYTNLKVMYDDVAATDIAPYLQELTELKESSAYPIKKFLMGYISPIWEIFAILTGSTSITLSKMPAKIPKAS